LIIFRYLSIQVLVTLTGTSTVLMLFIMSGRFIKYLAEAATGELSANVLFSIIAFRMPGFLELILPIGLFLAILMVHGRLYIDSEMTVLTACGISTSQLVNYTLWPSLLIAILVGALSMFVTPWGANKVDDILAKQDARTEFDALVPGRFQNLGSRGRVVYTESLVDGKRRMENVFISQREEAKNGRPATITILRAESGTQYVDTNTGSRYLLLQKGHRYDGAPGELDYRAISYDGYGIRIPSPQAENRDKKSELKSITELLASTDLKDIAQLQWRISLPLTVLIVSMIAIPLARVSPRQGRYTKLLPSICLYLGYLILLTTTTEAIGDGDIDPRLGLWWVHLLFLLIALMLLANVHRRRIRSNS